MDPLLRKALGAAHTPVTPACVDSERLAAWSEGSLAADDAAQIELHLSTCGRCQAMAAVFSQIEPEAPVEVPFWRRRFVGWLIPLTAVATAAILWIARPRVPDLPLPTQVAQVQPQSVPAPLPPPAPSDRTAEVAAEAKTAKKPVTPVGATSDAQATAVPPVRTVPSPPPPPPPASLPSQPPPQAKLFTAPPTANAAPPPPAVAPAPPQPVTATADATQAGGAAFRSAAGVNESAVGIIEIVAPPPAMAQAAGGAGGGGRGGGGSRGAGFGGRGVAPSSPSPAPPPVRWRILPSNAVERSTTGGASWQPIVIDPPARLTGGVAASSTVCWLIGRAGVVLRSVDGIHFDRVTFPETGDLASIRSAGAAQASVTMPDGRVFVTTDGGLTWRLQGFPTSSF